MIFLKWSTLQNYEEESVLKKEETVTGRLDKTTGEYMDSQQNQQYTHFYKHAFHTLIHSHTHTLIHTHKPYRNHK